MHERERDIQLIAQKIKQLRKALNLRQKELAERISLDQTTISKWEGGKARPTPEALVRLAGIAEGADKVFFLAHAGIPDQFFMGQKVAQEIEAASARVIHRAVHESGMPEVSMRNVPLDRDLLVFAMETISSELRRKGRKLPVHKYAEAVALYYELCQESGRREAARAQQIIKKIA